MIVFDPTEPTLAHSEGTTSTFTFTVTETADAGAAPGAEIPIPTITSVVLSPILLTNATATILGTSATVVVGTGSLFPWSLHFKDIITNTIVTTHDTWEAPSNGAVFSYVKQTAPPLLTITINARSGDGQTTASQLYTITTTPNYSAGRDQLVTLAQASATILNSQS